MDDMNKDIVDMILKIFIEQLAKQGIYLKDGVLAFSLVKPIVGECANLTVAFLGDADA